MKIESDELRDRLNKELNMATRAIYTGLKDVYINNKSVNRVKWHFGFAEGIECALLLIGRMELEIDPHMNDEILGIVPDKEEKGE